MPIDQSHISGEGCIKKGSGCKILAKSNIMKNEISMLDLLEPKFVGQRPRNRRGNGVVRGKEGEGDELRTFCDAVQLS